MTLDREVDEAISRGLGYVLAAQEEDGAWTDWSLPPGPSREWVTADVGRRLSTLGSIRRDMLVEPLDRAAHWLAFRRAEGGGWGYNGAVQPDADSTAQALLFLSATNHACSEEAYGFLARHQRSDGGFATFLPHALAGSWGLSHPEVTPMALLALATSSEGVAEDRLVLGLAWLRSVRRHDGLWNSFWWTSPLVATELALPLLGALADAEPVPPALDSWLPADALDAALLLSTMAATGSTQRLGGLARQLVADQLDDGSWTSAAGLRVPARDCERPWEATSAGVCYADLRRLHTTATCLDALAAAERA